LYPDIEPYDRGFLSAGDGNAIYWECCGNRDGKPAIYFHGGPGSGCTIGARRFFDPKAYKIVLFDQRGCGRSRPLASCKADLENNTTQHLIADVESLRAHLSIERWVVLGSSWGTTLALAYAQAHPENIAALVLACVAMTSRREVEWLTCGVGRVFPRQWERFASFVSSYRSGASIVDAYAALLFDNDASLSERAAQEWCVWEDAHVSLLPGYASNPRFFDADFRLRFARIVTHYWRHAAFLEENQLLNNAGVLSAIPGTLVHGAHDVSSPLETAWELHKRWPKSRLDVVSDAGHGGGSMPDHIVAALDDFK
jgi:proline iminopeptidase